MVILKIIVLAACVAAYFGFMVFGPGYHMLGLQGALLILFALLNTVQKNMADTRAIVAFCLPFVASLLAFGLFFDWFALMGRQNWLADSLIKALVFPNSLLTVKLAAGSITYKDVLTFPLPSALRRNIIITKAVMEKCSALLPRHRFFMDMTPHFAHLSPIRRKCSAVCGTIIAAYISIYRETEKTQDLFDQRSRYLRKNS